MRSHTYGGLGAAFLMLLGQVAVAGDNCGCASAPAPPCCQPCQRCCHHHHCAPFIPQYIPGPVTAVIGVQTVPFAVVPTQTVIPVQSVVQSQAVFPVQSVLTSQAVVPSFAVANTVQPLAASSVDNSAATAALLSQLLKAQAASASNANANAHAASAQAANDQLNQRLTNLENRVRALTECLKKNLAE